MKCLITFRSVTPAQRAEGHLRRMGFECGIRRTPRWMEAQGCGYSLWVWEEEATRAAELLRQAQIPFRKAYLRRENGTMEELIL